MNLDVYARALPDNMRDEYIKGMARRDAQLGSRAFSKGFRSGYDHGWHDGQQDNGRIA